MNNIMFSKMTRRQIITAYKNKEYKKTIQMLRGIFTNREGFLKYLNDDVNDIDDISLRKFRDILYMWTVIDEFKQLLNDTIDVLTIACMQEYDKDYVKEFFSADEIKIIKEKGNKYFVQQKNKLLLKNYEDGNFDYVMDSLKNDYKDYYEYEEAIGINKGFAYSRAEIAPLRELSHILMHANYDMSKNNIERYKYAMLNNLITMHKYMSREYIERYLFRQKKIGIDIELCFFDGRILKAFSIEDRKTLNIIYYEYVKNGLKVNSGIGLYNKIEYTRKLHVIMNILELTGTNTDKYKIMKFNYRYTPKIVNDCISCVYAKKVFKSEILKYLEFLSSEYNKNYDAIVINDKKDEKEKLGLEIGRIITEFLDSNIDIDSYFNQNELLKKEYKRIQEYVKIYCPDVYDRFIDYRETRIKNAALMVKKAIINNTLETEIDYYSITNIPYSFIRNYFGKNDTNMYILFDMFIKKNPRENSINAKGVESIYNSVQTFNVTMSDGSIKNVEATLDDKKYIVSYLKYIGAPVTMKNISVGLRRLLNNNLYTESTSLRKRITL